MASYTKNYVVIKKNPHSSPRRSTLQDIFLAPVGFGLLLLLRTAITGDCGVSLVYSGMEAARTVNSYEIRSIIDEYHPKQKESEFIAVDTNGLFVKE
jgi:hypothetical protein